MAKCVICGRDTISYSKIKKDGCYDPVCSECQEELKKKEIEERLKDVEKASDFREWSSRDMSEAFWIHLGKFQKFPNKYSLSILERAYLWAVHSDHGLSNSFNHALEWCKIDIFSETIKENLPERSRDK